MKIREVDFGDFKMQCFENDWVGHHIIKNNSWEPHIGAFLKHNISKDSIFVDVGSNYGCHSILTSPLCKQVYSFEPQKPFFDLQKSTIKLNNISNIQVYNVALGASIKKSLLSDTNYLAEEVNMGDAHLGTVGSEIDVITLDSLGLEKVNFMKIDVQGYEKFVIEGSMETIMKSKTSIIVELEDWWLAGWDYSSYDLIKFLNEIGYEVFLLDNVYPSDHVCVHKDILNDFLDKNKDFIFELSEKPNGINQNASAGVKHKLSYNYL